MKTTQVCLAICALLTGCTAIPTVTYKKVNEASKSVIADSYFLNASRITVSPVKPTEKNPELAYTVNTESVEFLNEKIGVVPTNSFLNTVKINITKVENSDRVSAIGVDTTDNLKTLISTVGGVLVKAVGVVGLAPGGPAAGCTKALSREVSVPLDDMSKTTSEFKEYRFEKDDSATQCIRVDYDPLPQDAIEFDKFPWDSPTSNYFYSACRNAKITIKYPDNRTLVKSVRVADPRYVQFVQYPFKGSITMHSQCGVSVKTEAGPNVFSGLEALGEALKQIEAIRAAEKK